MIIAKDNDSNLRQRNVSRKWKRLDPIPDSCTHLKTLNLTKQYRLANWSLRDARMWHKLSSLLIDFRRRNKFRFGKLKKREKKSFLSCRKFRVDLSIAMGQKSFYWNVIADRMWKLNCETHVGNWAASRFPIIEPWRWISRVKWACDGCGCTRVKREKL